MCVSAEEKTDNGLWNVCLMAPVQIHSASVVVYLPLLVFFLFVSFFPTTKRERKRNVME